jgi:membrane-associated phospholipid phosphatase
MKLLVLLFTLLLAPTFAQEFPSAPARATEAQTVDEQQAQQEPPAATSPQTPSQADRSAIQVKPGGQVIKDKDLWEKTGYFHPFVRMPKYILSDQKNIWLAPFHTAKKDIKYWVIFGAATGALIATDKWTVKQLPNSASQVRLGNYTSNIGAAYSLVPLSAGFYFLGTAAKSDRFRETGLLGFETLIDTTIINTVIKAATHRARPLESNGEGHFWDSKGSVMNASFPSGHAINTFALASVFAHQYRNWPVRIIAYGLATTVVGARVSARRHFPGDVVAGAAMGWFIGDYVYGKRHNDELDKPSISQRVLDHVHFGFAVR